MKHAPLGRRACSRAPFAWLAALAGLAGLAGCTAAPPPTSQVIVYVWAEHGIGERLLALDLQVDSYANADPVTPPQLAMTKEVLVPHPGDLNYPYRLALRPANDDVAREFIVTATARSLPGGDAGVHGDVGLIARAHVRGRYILGRTLRVDLWLRDVCADFPACPVADEACDPNNCSCEDAVFGELIPLDADAGAPMDASVVCATGDGGSDAGT
jgi:hypothetical protein